MSYAIDPSYVLLLAVLVLQAMLTVWMSYMAHLFYRYVAGTDPPKQADRTTVLLEALYEQLVPRPPEGRTEMR